MLKKVISIMVGVIAIFAVGTMIMIPINIWYADTYLGSEDHTGQIFRFNVYLLWPIFVISGAWLGHFIHKKYLTQG